MTAGAPNMNQTFSGFGVIFLAVAGLFFLVLGFSTTGWFITSLPETETGIKPALKLGLWEVCTCFQPPTATPDYVKATHAFTILSLIILIVTNFLIGWMHCLADSPKGSILCTVLVMLVFATIFLLIAVSVYGAKVDIDTQPVMNIGSLSYSFAFTVIAMIICFLGSMMAFVEWRKTLA